MRGIIFIVFGFSILLQDTLGYAQVNSSLNGRIIDSETNTGVPFVTIKLSNELRGVISNVDGDFKIPGIYQVQSDTLVISCIGYNTRIVPLRNLEAGRVNLIELEVSITALSEIVIQAKKERQKSARKIVKTAIENIPANYPQTPFSYEAYYREYQLKDAEYVNLNEAFIEVLDDGFDTDDFSNSRIKLFEYSLNNDFPRDKATQIFYDNKGKKFIPGAKIQPNGGNELTILRIHDAIRNFEYPSYSFMYKLKDNFIENHFFKLKDPVFIDNVYLYRIEFRSTDFISGPEHYALGEILIQADDYAIHKLEYAVYRNENHDNTLLFDVQVEYAQHNSLMYLNYISFNNIFKVNNPLDFAIIDIRLDTIKSTLIVEFNNQPATYTLMDLANYKVKIDGQNIPINSVEVLGLHSNIIHLVLGNDDDIDFSRDEKPMNERLTFETKNIIDISGRKLGDASYLDVNQFRELFVQKQHTNQSISADTLFMDITKPLIDNNLSTGRPKETYWMNTPLRNIP